VCNAQSISHSSHDIHQQSLLTRLLITVHYVNISLSVRLCCVRCLSMSISLYTEWHKHGWTKGIKYNLLLLKVQIQFNSISLDGKLDSYNCSDWGQDDYRNKLVILEFDNLTHNNRLPLRLDKLSITKHPRLAIVHFVVTTVSPLNTSFISVELTYITNSFTYYMLHALHQSALVPCSILGQGIGKGTFHADCW